MTAAQSSSSLLPSGSLRRTTVVQCVLLRYTLSASGGGQLRSAKFLFTPLATPLSAEFRGPHRPEAAPERNENSEPEKKGGYAPSAASAQNAPWPESQISKLLPGAFASA